MNIVDNIYNKVPCKKFSKKTVEWFELQKILDTTKANPRQPNGVLWRNLVAKSTGTQRNTRYETLVYLHMRS